MINLPENTQNGHNLKKIPNKRLQNQWKSTINKTKKKQKNKNEIKTLQQKIKWNKLNIA